MLSLTWELVRFLVDGKRQKNTDIRWKVLNALIGLTAPRGIED